MGIMSIQGLRHIWIDKESFIGTVLATFIEANHRRFAITSDNIELHPGDGTLWCQGLVSRSSNMYLRLGTC